MAVLLVEFGKLIKIVIVDPIAAFNCVEFLTSGAEVETLMNVRLVPGRYLGCLLPNLRVKLRTSVLIANGGFQLSGGMIFTIPYLLPC